MKKAYVFFCIIILVLCAGISFSETQQNPSQPVDRAKHLRRSGVAYDAYETISGLIKIVDPRSFFRPTTKQVTWWGEFKPFSTWSRPNLHARWFNPEGQLVSSQDFQPEECRLAKATLTVRPSNIEMREGRWQVEILMDGKPIDRKNFVVFNPSRPPMGSSPVQDVQIESTSAPGGEGQ